MSKNMISALALLVVAFGSAAVHAQEAPEAAQDSAAEETPAAVEETPAVEEAPVVEEAPDESAESFEAAEAAEEVAQPLSGQAEDPMYWAQMRDVYTVQKREFQKQGRFALSVYGGMIPNNAFERYIPVGLRLNYFILENIGLELATSYAISMSTGLEDFLSEPAPGLGAQRILVGDTQISHTNFGILWSPFYGKTAFYNTILNYFDLYLFAGAGLVITETVPDFNAEPEQEFKPEGALGAGMAFYLGDHATLRIDFRQFIFAKVAGVGGVATPSEASLGLGWFF
ncbi:outer membrane beta-barrel domain-containing protein [Microvenator marinus]|nr:outer membrane beta-barrel domain-containing protein [Microvenator marinus]